MNLSDYTKKNESYVFGWLGYDGQSIVDRSCLLREGNSGYELSIPFKGDPDEMSSWFVNGYNIFDTKDHRKEGALPDKIWIEDSQSNSTYCLLNPRVVGRVTHPGEFRGTGLLASDYVVIGRSGIDYSKINTMRTYYPELNDWTGLSPVQTDLRFDNNHQGYLEAFSCGYEKTDPLPICEIDDVRLLFKPAGATSSNHKAGIEIKVSGYVYFQTESHTKNELSKHMDFHRNLQSLLSIISWRDISYRDVFIQVNEDFCIYPTGEKGNPRFRRLITKRYGIWERPAHTQPYLFSFKDLGAEGLTEWFSLCSRYSTPMRQLFHIVRMHRYMTLESQVLVFAIALEELCDALPEEGCEEKREKWCFATKLSCILKDILDRCPSVPKMRIDDISELISNTYASIKHTKPARHGKSGKIGFLLIIYFKLLWCAG